MKTRSRLCLTLFSVAFSSFVLSSCVSDTISDRRVGQMIICHKGDKTQTVSNASSFVHLEHGDTPGPCPDAEPDS